MSAPDNCGSPLRQHRLAFIHFLGWMAGVANGLGFYRNPTDCSELGEEEIPVALLHYG